jgi:hypothetical protein
MCNCPEVQEHRKVGFEEGDILANYYLRWEQVDKNTQKAQRVFCDIVMFDKTTHIKDRDLIIWLPRQSDIQDMLGYDFPFIARQFAIYADDCVEPEKFGSVLKTWCESMHEFWLVFYMREIHKKTWYGGTWKNIKHWNGMKWVDAKPERKEE